MGSYTGRRNGSFGRNGTNRVIRWKAEPYASEPHSHPVVTCATEGCETHLRSGKPEGSLCDPCMMAR